MSLVYLQRNPSTRMVCQELDLSCGAACARQLLLDLGVEVSERAVREHAEFYENEGIQPEGLAKALTRLSPGYRYIGGSVDPSVLPDLLLRCPFVALVDRHFVIVDAAIGDAMRIRDPAPLPTSPTQGTEGLVSRRSFEDAWLRSVHRVVFRGRDGNK